MGEINSEVHLAWISLLHFIKDLLSESVSEVHHHVFLVLDSLNLDIVELSHGADEKANEEEATTALPQIAHNNLGIYDELGGLKAKLHLPFVVAFFV